MSEIYDNIIRELTKPSERDKQRKVGPSELGDLCERCLAEKLLGVHEEEKTHSLAPMIGTAFHLYLENTIGLEGYLKETKVTVGTIEGYGSIRGTADGFDIETGHVVDYKVLSKKKIKAFSSATFFNEYREPEFYSDSMTEGQLKKYYYQMMLYGLGMENTGYDVHHCSLVLFPRDCTVESVMSASYELCFKYSREAALNVLERANQIFKWATNNRDNLGELDSHAGCYYCTFKR
nr:MAG TPA: Exonuclease [Caudoviricetes sp.]